MYVKQLQITIRSHFTRFAFYVASFDHNTFTLYAFCILRGQFRLNIQTRK